MAVTSLSLHVALQGSTEVHCHPPHSAQSVTRTLTFPMHHRCLIRTRCPMKTLNWILRWAALGPALAALTNWLGFIVWNFAVCGCLTWRQTCLDCSPHLGRPYVGGATICGRLDHIWEAPQCDAHQLKTMRRTVRRANLEGV